MNTLLTNLENGILTVTINRPDKLNALNAEVFKDLNTVLDEIEKNAEIKSVIITGSGAKAFVAGADITEFSGVEKDAAKKLSRSGQNTFFRIERCAKPVIAAVNGFALGGGCELAMACHFRICSDNAKFGQPEVNLGLIPGYGGTQRLTQLIGKGRSMEMNMTGAMINAQDALSWGLVNHVCDPGSLLDKAKEILTLIQTKAPVAIAKVIECVNASVDPARDGYEVEVNTFGECFATEDMIEGTTAFVEKRKAVFKGR